tara:strand:- start:4594 stop:5829 length:1236 start_codon:yes stop_codon:yes gene_type:complete
MQINNKILNRNNIIIFFFLFLILNYLFFNYRILARENGYILGDWVINYSGGFIKRGLLGHIFYSLSLYSSISIINIIFLFSSIIYLTSTYWFYRILKNRLDNNLIFIFALLPSTFLFNFFDPLTVGRKEILVYFFFTFYYLNIDKIDLFIKYKIITLISFIFIILTHEIIFFFIPYLFILKFLYKESIKFKLRDYLFEFLILFFGILIFLIILKINHLHNNEVLCNSLLNINLTKNSCWAINDFKSQITITFLYSYFIEKNYFKNYLIYFILTSIPLILLIFQSHNNKKKKFILLSILSLIFSLSFFGQVNDWGRYLNVIFLIQFLTILSFTKNDETLNITKHDIFYFIKLFIILFYLMSWHMPHCCNDKLGKGYVSVYERILMRVNDNSIESTKYNDLPRMYLRKLFKID